jgi:hypothetical protein
VLFIHQQLLLLVGDETHVDQDLSDATMCHEKSLVFRVESSEFPDSSSLAA